MPNEPPKASEPVVAILRCTTCGKVRKCSQSEVDLYMQENEWPRCCGQVMSVTLSGEWPRLRT
jgi:hypothetical protein